MLARISVKVGKKGKALAHANYIFAEQKYKNKIDEVVYTRSENLPIDCDKNPKKFWQAADEYERKNGSVYREHIISLPREFTLEQQIKMIDDWCEQEIKNQPFSYAIHHTKDKNGNAQPHAHLMFSDRKNDGIERTSEQFFKRYNAKNPDKGGAKKYNTGMTIAQQKEQLKQLRKRFETHLKNHLVLNNFSQLAEQVDMRNWRERGLSEEPKNKTMQELRLEKQIEKDLSEHPFYLDMKMTLEPPKFDKKKIEKKKESEIIIPILANDNDIIIGHYENINFSGYFEEYEILYDYQEKKIKEHNIQKPEDKTKSLLGIAYQAIRQMIENTRQFLNDFQYKNGFRVQFKQEQAQDIDKAIAYESESKRNQALQQERERARQQDNTASFDPF